MLPTLLADASTQEVGTWVLAAVIILTGLGQVKSLFFPDKTRNEEMVRKGDLDKTETELRAEMKRLEDQFVRLENYTRDSVHKTNDSINGLTLAQARMELKVTEQVNLLGKTIDTQLSAVKTAIATLSARLKTTQTMLDRTDEAEGGL